MDHTRGNQAETALHRYGSDSDSDIESGSDIGSDSDSGSDIDSDSDGVRNGI